jgi:adenylylsulfate kinase
MKILIFGLPGSGKTTLAKPLAELLGGIHINADEVRTHYNDWDFTPEGRMRQAMRMKYLSDGVVKAGKIVVTDFVAPTKQARDEFGADYTIWMNTIDAGRFEDTNKMFVKPDPTDVDYEVSAWFDDTHVQLLKVLSSFMKRNDNE